MKRRIRNWIWPSLSNVTVVRQAAHQGTWAAVLVALMPALLAAVSLVEKTPSQIDTWAFVDTLQFAVIAFAIYKMSRVAAILGLTIYLIQRIVIWATVGSDNIILTSMIMLAFVNSVRGTVVYHRLVKIPK